MLEINLIVLIVSMLIYAYYARAYFLRNRSKFRVHFSLATLISSVLSFLFWNVYEIWNVKFGEYDLEVSTPGIDRPLTIEEDFNRFKGFDVKIMTSYPINDRRKFTGKLLGIDANPIPVKMALHLMGLIESPELRLPMMELEKANKKKLADELSRLGLM